MPWLTELGIEPTATNDEAPVEETAFSNSVRSVRNLETTDLQELVAEALTQEPSPSEEPSPAAQPSAADAPSPEAETSAAEQTLAQLREPDALIPATVQVLEEPPAPTQPEPVAQQEEPPLSPEEMAELARGLLEVVLR